MKMKAAKEIRAEAWRALGENGQYLRYVAAYLLMGLVLTLAVVAIAMLMGAGFAISGIGPFLAPGGKPDVGLLADAQIMVPLMVTLLVCSVLFIYPAGYGAWGQAAMSIATMRRGLGVGHAFAGWGHGWHMGWIVMVKATYVFFWSLLFVVPGLVKALSYAMTEFVAVDHPGWTANQCITESRRLMDGHKWRYFCLLLSFVGWILLMSVASAIPFLGNLAPWFFMPYFESAKAAFYEELLDAREAPPATGREDVTDYTDPAARGGVV